MMRSVETVCSNSCYMLADKKHFRNRSRLAGTAMLPKRLSTSKKKKKKSNVLHYVTNLQEGTYSEFARAILLSFLKFFLARCLRHTGIVVNN